MREFTPDDLERALRQVGLTAGETVLVHSALFSLGKLVGVSSARIPEVCYQRVKAVIGDGGTVVVPAFNFGFCKGQLFDPAETPSAGMGVFSEYVRRRSDAHRSRHPMQSFAAVGPAAEWITAPDTPSAFDESGCVARLLEKDACLVLLGAPTQSASLVHFPEERRAVPYRHWKEFTGPYRVDGGVETRTYRMYVRDLQRDPRLDLSRIEARLRAHGEFAEARLGCGWIRACRARAFVERAEEMLRQDPESLLVEQRHG